FQADIRAKQARREETAHEEALLAAADEAGKLYLDDEGNFAPPAPAEAICRGRGILYRAEKSPPGATINLRTLVYTKTKIQDAKQAVDAWTTTYHELTAAADEAAS